MLCRYTSLENIRHLDISFKFTYTLTRLFPFQFAITVNTILTENCYNNLSRISMILLDNVLFDKTSEIYLIMFEMLQKRNKTLKRLFLL